MSRVVMHSCRHGTHADMADMHVNFRSFYGLSRLKIADVNKTLVLVIIYRTSYTTIFTKKEKAKEGTMPKLESQNVWL